MLPPALRMTVPLQFQQIEQGLDIDLDLDGQVVEVDELVVLVDVVGFLAHGAAEGDDVRGRARRTRTQDPR